MLRVKQVINADEDWTTDRLYLNETEGIFSLHLRNLDFTSMRSIYVPTRYLQVNHVERRGGEDLLGAVRMLYLIVPFGFIYILISQVNESRRPQASEPMTSVAELLPPFLIFSAALIILHWLLLRFFPKSKAIRVSFDETANGSEETDDDIRSIEIWSSKSRSSDTAELIDRISSQTQRSEIRDSPVSFEHDRIYSSPIRVGATAAVMALGAFGLISVIMKYVISFDVEWWSRFGVMITIGVAASGSLWYAWWSNRPLPLERRKLVRLFLEGETGKLLETIKRILEVDPGNTSVVSLLVNLLVRQDEYQRAFDSLALLDPEEAVLKEVLRDKIARVEAWRA